MTDVTNTSPRPAVPGSPGVFRPLIALALPIVLSMSIQMANAFLDLALASRHAVDTLAAVSVGIAIEALPVAFVAGLAYAVVPRIGLLKSAGGDARVQALLAQGGVAVLLLSALFGLMVWTAGDTLLRLSGVAAELLPGARVYVGFIPFTVLGCALFMLLRYFIEAYRQPLLVTGAVLAGLLVKAASLYLLAFGGFGLPSFGVAAFGASAVVYFVTLNACLLLASRLRGDLQPVWRGRLCWADVAPRQLWAFFRDGLPIGGNFLSDIFVLAVMNLSIAAFGAAAIGAHSLAFNALGNFLIVAGGVAMAAGILASQLGAQGDRAGVLTVVGKSLALGLAAALCFAALARAFGDALLGLYGADAALLPLAQALLALFPALLAATTAVSVLSFVLRGLGDSVAVFVISLGGAWLVLLPLGYFQVLGGAADDTVWRGVSGWWWAYVVSQGLMAAGLALRLRWRLARLHGAAGCAPDAAACGASCGVRRV